MIYTEGQRNRGEQRSHGFYSFPVGSDMVSVHQALDAVRQLCHVEVDQQPAGELVSLR